MKPERPRLRASKAKPKRHSLIRSAIRQLWMYGDERKEALKRAKIKPGLYYCAGCRGCARRENVEVDHIVPVGPTPGSRNAGPDDTWDAWMERLFCPVEGLRVLCKDCHNKRRTGEWTKEISERCSDASSAKRRDTPGQTAPTEKSGPTPRSRQQSLPFAFDPAPASKD